MTWTGIDGEGLGRDPHRYVLLAASDVHGQVRYIENLKGLPSKDCLEFLLRAPARARIAGYYLGYDYTMMLGDLPNKKVYRLLRPELRALPRDEGGGFSRVSWRNIRMHYMNGMLLLKQGKKKVTIWDVGKFFQGPFVDAIEAWEILDAIDLIREMKAERDKFTEDDYPKIKRYCFEECRALARLVTALEKAHEDIGLRPSVWFGPGSTATVGLRRLGIKKKRGEPPPEVERAADYAFFGGRFEHSTIGTLDAVAGYDIISAYPFQAYNLPCLEHARWQHTTRSTIHTVLVHYRLHDIGKDEPWGPLPCRMPNGTILFPRGGSSGWVWRDEWDEACAFPGNATLEFLEGWELHSDCNCHVFKRIEEWFRDRIALGKSVRGRVLKLFLNSLYGKLAQSVGSRQFASRVWAGMITSGTRAQLLRLLWRHRDRRNCLALATDGLYSREVLQHDDPGVAGTTLGTWEAEYHGKMTFVRPGIYWSHDDDTLRARGVGRRQLKAQRDAVLQAIEAGAEYADLGTATVFGGARACVYRTPNELKRSRHYGQWHEFPARVSLDPAPKRQKDWSLWMLPGVESAPYKQDVLSDDARMLRVVADVMWATQQ